MLLKRSTLHCNLCPERLMWSSEQISVHQIKRFNTDGIQPSVVLDNRVIERDCQIQSSVVNYTSIYYLKNYKLSSLISFVIQ